MASIFKTENCPICGNPTNALEKTSAKCEGKFICKSCGKKLMDAGINLISVNKMSASDLKQRIGASNKSATEKEEEAKTFNVTKQVADFFYLDSEQNKFAIPIRTAITGKVKGMDVYNCEYIIDFELLEDGDSVSKGGVGRALVGGALFGGVGAIVGGSTGHKQRNTCTKMQIKITMNSLDNPTAYINLLDFEQKRNTLTFRTIEKQAQEILSLLNVICQEEEPSAAPVQQNRQRMRF